MRVVVTGATGNVGTSVLRALAADPAIESVLGLARRRPRLELPKTRFAAADVASTDLVPHLRGADAVIHLAWLIQPSRDQAETRRTNVRGSARVLEAVAQAGVPALVYASSVGAYSRGPKDRAVDESWPTDGIPSSFYSRHKAEVERLLDLFERNHGDVRVVRLRPGLIFKREAGAGIRRLFAGPFLPSPLVRRGLVPVVPDLPGLRFQAVHSLDVGDAYRRAVIDDVHGAFNLAAEPVLDPSELARVLGARRVPMSAGAIRAVVRASHSARLQPTPSGWLDLALGVPIMDVTRARAELGWQPSWTAGEALLDLMAGMRDSSGEDTPPLAPRSGGRLRWRELAAGVGGRSV
jgi:nucleoside-diphosphate-sugar epimerase